MARLGTCPTCKKKVSENAEICPSCGEPLGADWREETAARQKSQALTSRVFVLSAILVVVGYVMFGGPSEEEKAREAAAKAAEEAENRRKGFHCLSGWDGSHIAVKEYVEARLKDPDSFEHIETRVSPIRDDGTHTLTMKYRARNGFGGMTIGQVVATYKNSNCQATVVLMD